MVSFWAPLGKTHFGAFCCYMWMWRHTFWAYNGHACFHIRRAKSLENKRSKTRMAGPYLLLSKLCRLTDNRFAEGKMIGSKHAHV